MAEETEYELVEVTNEALPGAATPLGAVDELGDQLLGLIGEMTKLSVQLSEADEDEFRAIEKRLRMLKMLAGTLPDAPQARRKVGFQPPSEIKIYQAKPKGKLRSKRRKR